MKKNQFLFLMIILSVTTIIYSCTKENIIESSVMPQKKLHETISNFVPAGATCQVPVGFTSCSATCTFSDCCVVWNPNLETGGCACYFGVSTCKTTKIGSSEPKGVVINSTSSKRTITFHFKKFEDFLNKCKVNGMEVQLIVKSYESNLSSIEGLESGIVNNERFDSFMIDYENFINTLSTTEKKKIKLLIN